LHHLVSLSIINRDPTLELQEFPSLYPPDTLMEASHVAKLESDLQLARSAQFPDDNGDQDDDI